MNAVEFLIKYHKLNNEKELEDKIRAEYEGECSDDTDSTAPLKGILCLRTEYDELIKFDEIEYSEKKGMLALCTTKKQLACMGERADGFWIKLEEIYLCSCHLETDKHCYECDCYRRKIRLNPDDYNYYFIKPYVCYKCGEH